MNEDSGQTAPEAEPSLEEAIERHARKQVEREMTVGSYVVVGFVCVGVVWGWVKGGGGGALLGAVLGLIAGGLLSVPVMKVWGWFH